MFSLSSGAVLYILVWIIFFEAIKIKSHRNICFLNCITGEKNHVCFILGCFAYSPVSLSLFKCIPAYCVYILFTQGCPQYWPEEGMLRYGPVQVECMSCSMDCDVISRLFRVCNLTRVSRKTLLTYRPLCFLLPRVTEKHLNTLKCVIFQPQEGYLMVRQFQYLGWAGHREVPASKRSFLKLILQVDQWQREGEEGEGRTIVHCL